MVQEYVLGFALSKDKENILLIKKNRPAYQAGKLNGIGGKVESVDRINNADKSSFVNNSIFYNSMLNDIPIKAMVREFEEETGLITDTTQWQHYATLNSPYFKVFVFWSILDNFDDYKTMETEEVMSISIKKLMSNQFNDCMESVGFLITMLFNSNVEKMVAEINYK